MLVIYFTLYALTIIVLTSIIRQQNTNTINKTISINKTKKINLYLIILSLGGMPPLLGFFPKIIVISGVLLTSRILLPLALVASSIVNLYFYLRMTYSSLVVISTNQHLAIKPSINTPLILTLLGPLIPLIY